MAADEDARELRVHDRPALDCRARSARPRHLDAVAVGRTRRVKHGKTLPDKIKLLRKRDAAVIDARPRTNRRTRSRDRNSRLQRARRMSGAGGPAPERRRHQARVACRRRTATDPRKERNNRKHQHARTKTRNPHTQPSAPVQYPNRPRRNRSRLYGGASQEARNPRQANPAGQGPTRYPSRQRPTSLG